MHAADGGGILLLRLTVFGNGDLLLRSPIEVTVPVPRSTGVTLEDVVGAVQAAEPALAMTRQLFSLSGVRIVTPNQLECERWLVASCDATCATASAEPAGRAAEDGAVAAAFVPPLQPPRLVIRRWL